MNTKDPEKLWPLLLEGALPFDHALPVSHPIRADHLKMALETLPFDQPKVVFCREEALERMRELPGYEPVERFCQLIPAEVPVGEAFCVALSDQVRAVRLMTPASASWK